VLDICYLKERGVMLNEGDTFDVRLGGHFKLSFVYWFWLEHVFKRRLQQQQQQQQQQQHIKD